MERGILASERRASPPTEARELRCQNQVYSATVAIHAGREAIQARKGSRDAYAHVEESGGWRTEFDDKLKGFLAATDSFYLAPRPPMAILYPASRRPKGLHQAAGTRTRSRSPTTAATGNTSRRATFRKIPRRIFRDGLRPSPPRQDLGRGRAWSTTTAR